MNKEKEKYFVFSLIGIAFLAMYLFSNYEKKKLKTLKEKLLVMPPELNLIKTVEI